MVEVVTPSLDVDWPRVHDAGWQTVGGFKPAVFRGGGGGMDCSHHRGSDSPQRDLRRGHLPAKIISETFKPFGSVPPFPSVVMWGIKEPIGREAKKIPALRHQ